MLLLEVSFFFLLLPRLVFVLVELAVLSLACVTTVIDHLVLTDGITCHCRMQQQMPFLASLFKHLNNCSTLTVPF